MNIQPGTRKKLHTALLILAVSQIVMIAILGMDMLGFDFDGSLPFFIVIWLAILIAVAIRVKQKEFKAKLVISVLVIPFQLFGTIIAALGCTGGGCGSHALEYMWFFSTLFHFVIFFLLWGVYLLSVSILRSLKIVRT